MGIKGSYLLLIYLDKDTLIKTKGKEFYLNKGYYIYVGSAMNGIKRLFRHFKKHKKKHWHIDFLLEHSEIIYAIFIISNTRLEEELSKKLEKFGEPILNFGNSDIKNKSNLFYFKNNPIDLLDKLI